MNHLIPLALLALAACSQIEPPTLIERDRVLGAKVTVDGDAARAWPAPGERATMTWLTASPGESPTFNWILAACPAVSGGGVPACAGPVFATSEDSGAVPALVLDVPADMMADAIVVAGAICGGGRPSIDESTAVASCDDGSQAELVSQHVFIARDGAVNHNPDLAGAPFELDGGDWNAAADDAGCDGELLDVAVGVETVVLGVTFAAADREAFEPRDPARPGREELQLSGFATAGEIIQERGYVDFDDEREASPVAFEWEPPAADEVPPEGLRVVFHFVVRDLRGGVDATIRALCVR